MDEKSTPKSSSGSGGCIIGIIVTVVILVLLWQGVSWAFNQYVDLLKVN